MKDFGLVAVTAFGLIVAVFVAAGLVHKEVEKRTVFVLFSKPVSRAAFIAGKFLGLCATMAVVLAGMGAFLFLLVWAVDGDAVGHGARGRRNDLRAAAGRDGRHHLLLDAGLGHPRQRPRHLRLRRRAAEPQRAVADAPRARTRSPRRSRGSSTWSSPTSRPWTSRPAWWGRRRSPGVRSPSGAAICGLRRRRAGAGRPRVPPQGVLSACGACSPSRSWWRAPAPSSAYQVTQTGAGAGRRPRLRAVAAVLPGLLAELPHVDRRLLLPLHGPVLRRARRRRRPARLAAGDGRPGHEAQPEVQAGLSLRGLRAH